MFFVVNVMLHRVNQDPQLCFWVLGVTPKGTTPKILKLIFMTIKKNYFVLTHLVNFQYFVPGALGVVLFFRVGIPVAQKFVSPLKIIIFNGFSQGFSKDIKAILSKNTFNNLAKSIQTILSSIPRFIRLTFMFFFYKPNVHSVIDVLLNLLVP